MRCLLNIILFILFNLASKVCFSQYTISSFDELIPPENKLPLGLKSLMQSTDSTNYLINEFDQEGNIVFVKYNHDHLHSKYTSIIYNTYSRGRLNMSYYLCLGWYYMEVKVRRYYYDTVFNQIKSYRLIKKWHFKKWEKLRETQNIVNAINTSDQFLKSVLLKTILNKKIKTLYAISKFNQNNQVVSKTFYKPIGIKYKRADSFIYNHKNELIVYKTPIRRSGYITSKYQYLDGLKIKETEKYDFRDRTRTALLKYTIARQLDCRLIEYGDTNDNKFGYFGKDTFTYNDAGLISKKTTRDFVLERSTGKESEAKLIEESTYFYDAFGLKVKEINSGFYFNKESIRDYKNTYTFY